MKEKVDQILGYLNQAKLRATYGAVAGVLGVNVRSVGNYLGNRRPEASWVVKESTGLPTGYLPTEYHPDLLAKKSIIKTANVLNRNMNN